MAGGPDGRALCFNQMRVGGLEARAHDETFPQALGMAGEETIGPGGFANALRTIPPVLAALQVIDEVAPEAIVLNLTNPAGIVQHAAARYTRTRFISLCDSPITLANDVAKLLDMPREQLEIDYLGMNHLGWIIGVFFEGQDMMERVLEQIDRLAYIGVDSAYIRATRAIPIPYVRYYLHPGRMLAQQQGKTPRARQLQALEQDLLAAFQQTTAEDREASNPSAVLGRRGALWYSAIVVPVLDALIHDRDTIWVVNVVNNHTIPWLPAETVIEVPARILQRATYPLPTLADMPGVPSSELRTLLFALAAYESLAVSAIVEGKRELALQALVAHPLVRSLEQAEHVLAAVWPTGGVAP